MNSINIHSVNSAAIEKVNAALKKINQSTPRKVISQAKYYFQSGDFTEETFLSLVQSRQTYKGNLTGFDQVKFFKWLKSELTPLVEKTCELASFVLLQEVDIECEVTFVYRQEPAEDERFYTTVVYENKGPYFYTLFEEELSKIEYTEIT